MLAVFIKAIQYLEGSQGICPGFSSRRAPTIEGKEESLLLIAYILLLIWTHSDHCLLQYRESEECFMWTRTLSCALLTPLPLLSS